jgi:hypothetical protein
MAVDSSQLDTVNRDAYWLATQVQLRSAQQRGDILSLVAFVPIGAVLWYYGAPGDKVAIWAASFAIVALAAVALPQLLVARRKRRISAARGMNCQHCGYVPHQTEISEIVNTRQCRRCEQPLG